MVTLTLVRPAERPIGILREMIPDLDMELFERQVDELWTEEELNEFEGDLEDELKRLTTMTALLDTNALIFATAGSTRLTAAAADLIRDPATELIASAISVFEVGTKHRKGRLAVPATTFRRACLGLGVAFRAVSDVICVRAADLDWATRDPWDRVIAATALAAGANIVSSDGEFDLLEGLERVW